MAPISFRAPPAVKPSSVCKGSAKPYRGNSKSATGRNSSVHHSPRHCDSDDGLCSRSVEVTSGANRHDRRSFASMSTPTLTTPRNRAAMMNTETGTPLQTVQTTRLQPTTPRVKCSGRAVDGTHGGQNACASEHAVDAARGGRGAASRSNSPNKLATSPAKNHSFAWPAHITDRGCPSSPASSARRIPSVPNTTKTVAATTAIASSASSSATPSQSASNTMLRQSLVARVNSTLSTTIAGSIRAARTGLAAAKAAPTQRSARQQKALLRSSHTTIPQSDADIGNMGVRQPSLPPHERSPRPTMAQGAPRACAQSATRTQFVSCGSTACCEPLASSGSAQGAACCVQRWWRMLQCKHRLRAILARLWWRMMNEVLQVDSAACRLQGGARMMKLKSKRQHALSMVRRLQAWYRGMYVRSAVRMLRSAALNLQRWWKHHLSRKRILQRLPFLKCEIWHRAAITIQCIWRGALARRRFAKWVRLRRGGDQRKTAHRKPPLADGGYRRISPSDLRPIALGGRQRRSTVALTNVRGGSEDGCSVLASLGTSTRVRAGTSTSGFSRPALVVEAAVPRGTFGAAPVSAQERGRLPFRDATYNVPGTQIARSTRTAYVSPDRHGLGTGGYVGNASSVLAGRGAPSTSASVPASGRNALTAVGMSSATVTNSGCANNVSQLLSELLGSSLLWSSPKEPPWEHEAQGLSDLETVRSWLVSSLPTMEVKSVLRVECGLAAAAYSGVRLSLGPERLLWHGTSWDSVGNIVRHGFNRAYSGRHGAKLGRGSYFTEDPTYALRFCGRTPTRAVFLAGVLLGRYCRGEENWVEPPQVDASGARFNSTVDDIERPKVFCVFRDFQALPLYLAEIS
eukprot:TRINITY_DN61783_c0_g1_i1.p1 TRINITY_DN61783_c0_g1~~TRINITY_DN61783_c0_g1_i1.p1  ORF type:complete len:858 (+),score=67.48 TRINITY_DN61783_c0_g1_i1:151-2724(+)